MKRKIQGSLFILSVLVLTLFAVLTNQQPAMAQNVDVCYVVADHTGGTSSDALLTLNRTTGEIVVVGQTGTTSLEAIAMEPGTGPLYGADSDQLGTLSLTDGTFTPTSSPFGTGSGSLGNIEFDDVDGLTVDPISGTLYGVQRVHRPDPDVLFQINKTTGAFVPGAFGGDDYVVITGNILDDIDDIAVDPITGQMYGASNTGGEGGFLVRIDKATGVAETIGPFNIDDIEGLAFFNDGQLYGSTGNFAGDPATRNELFTVNTTTGQATLVAPFGDTQYTDFEALACLMGGPTAVSFSTAADTVTGASLPVVVIVAVLSTLVAVTMFVIWRRRLPLF